MTIEGERFVSIEGRIKDLINRGGEKINAEEVALLLLRHPGVSAAAVVPMPDPRLGERVCAYLVVDGAQLTLPEVHEHFTALESPSSSGPNASNISPKFLAHPSARE